jgi:O-antigen ligase
MLSDSKPAHAVIAGSGSMLPLGLKRPWSDGDRQWFWWTAIILGMVGAMGMAIGAGRSDLALLLSCVPLFLLLASVLVHHPHWALLLMAGLYMFSFQIEYRGITSNIILMLICLIGIYVKKEKFFIQADKTFIAFLTFYVLLIIYSSFKTHGEISYYDLNMYINNIVIMMFMFLFSSTEKVEQFYKVIVWCSVALVFIGFYQLATIGMPRGGMTGHYGNHVVYALHMAWGIPFSIYFLKKRAGKSYQLALLLQIIGITLAFSRGVLLAVLASFVLSGLVFLFYDSRKRTRLLIAGLSSMMAMIALIAIVAVLPSISKSANQHAFEITSGRNILYQSAWEIIKQHPVTGIGWQNYKEVWSDYIYIARPKYGSYYGDKKLNPHSSYLKVIAELGLVGFFVFAVFNWRILKLVMNNIMKSEVRPIFALLLIYFMHGLVDNNSYGNDRMFYMIAGIFFSILFIYRGNISLINDRV